jgi:hypothetical protein
LTEESISSFEKLHPKSKQKLGEVEAGWCSRFGVVESMDGGWRGGYRLVVLRVAEMGEKHKE